MPYDLEKLKAAVETWTSNPKVCDNFERTSYKEVIKRLKDDGYTATGDLIQALTDAWVYEPKTGDRVLAQGRNGDFVGEVLATFGQRAWVHDPKATGFASIPQTHDFSKLKKP